MWYPHFWGESYAPGEGDESPPPTIVAAAQLNSWYSKNFHHRAVLTLI